MAVTWTEEQRQVIEVRDQDVLVSAAAGSGKTAVLVERIISRITDPVHPVDIDRLLVVTFTNAAASEMRERIRDALEQRAEDAPEDVHLQKQLVLIHHASITTIHSFCLHVLRSHFHTIGLDPVFRIADEGECRLLEQDTVKEVLDEAYEQGKPEFYDFLERLATGRSDDMVEELILQLYHFSLGHPWPDEWLEECCQMYEKAANDKAEENGESSEQCADTTNRQPWLDAAVQDVRSLLQDIRGELQQAMRIADSRGGPSKYLSVLESDEQMLASVFAAEDYDSLAAAFGQMGSFARLPVIRDKGVAEELKAQVQEIRNNIKKEISDIRDRYFYEDPEVLREEFYGCAGMVRMLTELTNDFAERFSRKKSEKNLLDFGDLEHLALKILLEKKDGQWGPSAAAQEYAAAYEEIMTDEYQDSNLVQELILDSISGAGCGAHNRFMVGDVKQSIYRFRLARPELFMEKYRTYVLAEQEQCCRIDLHKNFRSRPEVLEGVNYIFRQIMTSHLGGIVYDNDAALYPGAAFADGNDPEFLPIEFTLLEQNGNEKAAGSKQEEEARLVGKRILEIVGKKPVWDKELEAYRPAAWRDIVILLRTVSGWAEPFQEILSGMGIPCFTGSQTGYFSAAEVRTVLSYLQILDNPIQDIPLAGAMRSAIGGFTDEELALIRARTQEEHFYECCMEFRRLDCGDIIQIQAKLDQFFAVYDRLRAKTPYTPVHLLLWEILDVTGYGAYVSALPAGQQRMANLDMLVEKAIAYEATSYRGLYHFVRYIENLKKYEVDYGEANVIGESEDTVRIMSIHKSKGLEFPIVFVCGMAKKFNESDARSRIVLHPDLGIGCDYVDPDKRLKSPNLLKKVIQRRISQENLGEELRILYVAMTRAKEKLILTGTVSDFDKAVAAGQMILERENTELTYSDLSSATCYLDWVLPAILHHPDAKHWRGDAEKKPEEGVEQDIADGISSEPETNDMPQFLCIHARTSEQKLHSLLTDSEEALRLQRLLELDLDTCYDEQAAGYLDRVFHLEYPYEKDRLIRGKLSVSELKRMSQADSQEECEQLYPPEEVVPLIPKFCGGQEAATGAARGTIYHSFLQVLDFSRKEPLEIQLEELIKCGKMTREESKSLNLTDIRRFLETDIGKRMCAAAERGTLFREQPFVIGVPADTVDQDWNPNETVLIQGIIDAFFYEEDENIVLLDYKTDRVLSPKVLVEKYRPQLDYYAMALERLTGRQVKRTVIYSFHLGREIIL
jgi:ATP-dependent helicase/nuclease subunit A